MSSARKRPGRHWQTSPTCLTDRAHCEKPHISKLVSISQLWISLLYMYLVHLWLVEITCRLECISAAAKWSPGRQMRPIKRSGDPDIPNYRSDWRIEKLSCQSPCPNFWLSKYTVLVSIFVCRTAQTYCGPPKGTIWVVHWANQDFSVAAALVHAWCDVSEWHKFAIAIITLVFPEPGDCWGCISWQNCHWSNYCDDEFGISNQITSVGIFKYFC